MSKFRSKMGPAIKVRNFTPKKCEDTFEKDGFGWAPGQEKHFKGGRISRDNEKYGKNFARLLMLCKKCKLFDKSIQKADGSHCKLGKGRKCPK